MNTEREEFKHDEQDMEARLWSYLDGESTEASAIEDLLAENSKWKEKYGELLETFTLLKEVELEQPSMRFTKDVMEEIARHQIAPATKKHINQKIIWGIAAFFITVIAGFVVFALSQVNWTMGSSNSDSGFDFSAIDYSKMFNNTFVNAFMMLNVVLGLFLLDRFLNMKRKRMREG